MGNIKVNKIKLLDSTLREGKQSILSGVLLKKELKYLKVISEIGIREIEINHPQSSLYWLKIYKKLIVSKLPFKIFIHTRVKRENLDLLVKLPTVKYLSVFVEKRDILLQNDKVGISSNLKRFLEVTRSRNLEIRVGIEDCFTFSPAHLLKIYEYILRHANVIRVGLADTYGYIKPEVLVKYTKYLDKRLNRKIEIEFHLHNDHGLAASNFYFVLSNISTERKLVFSVSFAGLGERNGILSYGEAFSILYLMNRRVLLRKYNLTNYNKLSELIFGKNIAISYRDPLMKSSFAHAATSHISNLFKSGKFNRIKPEDFGYEHDVVIGNVIGTESISLISRHYFNNNLDEDKAKMIAKKIRERIHETNKNYISTRELKRFIKQYA